jgi:RimJ/RimL family protein N-acetyltransferase
VRVEALTPDDWRVWRDLRLEGLQDTPIAFLESYDDARARTDDEWRERIAAPPRPGLHVCAYDGDVPVGIAGVFRDEAEVPVVFGVYITPSARGKGVLAALVEAAAAWAAPDRLTLEVHEDNPRAHRAYVKLGFAETGERRPDPVAEGDLLRMRQA